MSKKILLVGGYGNAGFLIAKYLLQETTDTFLTLAGRNLAKAQKACDKLNKTFPGNRTSPLKVDVTEAAEFKAAISKTDLVIMASSTIKQSEFVIKEVLQANIDYFDLQLSSTEKLKNLYAHQKEIEQSGRCFITDGGFHPGVPAAMVRYAANYFDQLEKANIYGGLKIDWAAIEASEGTMQELLMEFRDYKSTTLKNGKWKKMSMLALPPKFDFGQPLGRLNCAPMFLEELKTLPANIPGLKETGFYVSGFNPVMDYLILPIVMFGIKIVPERLAGIFVKMFEFGLRFNKPPYGVKLVADCKGIKDGKSHSIQLSISHTDEYVLTAVPVVACLLQYLDEIIKQPGLWFQANVVKSERFFEDMKRMGLALKRSIK